MLPVLPHGVDKNVNAQGQEQEDRDHSGHVADTVAVGARPVWSHQGKKA